MVCLGLPLVPASMMTPLTVSEFPDAPIFLSEVMPLGTAGGK